MRDRSTSLVLAVLLALALAPPRLSHAADSLPGAPWDSVAAILETQDVFASGYHRFNLPRRDITLRVGDVTLAPELAQGIAVLPVVA